MKSLFAISLASLYGFILHFMYGFLGGVLEIMSISFLGLVPLAIGFLTVALYKPKEDIKPGAAFCLPWLTSLVLLVVTIALSVEGAVCWIMIFPFFAVMAGFGGLIARYLLKERRKSDKSPSSDTLDDLDDWGKPGNLKSAFLLMLPLLFGAVEGDRTLSSEVCDVQQKVIINAPAAKVWAQLTRLDNIQPVENHSWMTRSLGMPRHLRTELDTLAVGGHRTAIYERGLFFDETITYLDENRAMTVEVKADPLKIPPTVMDEHIVVGGRYFSTIEDKYVLETLPDGRCLLSLSGKYTITTPFNWYAGVWAQWLVEDVLNGVLQVVKDRSELPG